VKIHALSTRARPLVDELPHDSDVDLQLLARLAVGDRDRYPSFAEAELADGVAVKRRVRDRVTIAREELAHLRELHSSGDECFDLLAQCDATLPRIAARTTAPRRDLCDHTEHALVSERLEAVPRSPFGGGARRALPARADYVSGRRRPTASAFAALPTTSARAFSLGP
jgi:hypothetical protein